MGLRQAVVGVLRHRRRARVSRRAAPVRASRVAIVPHPRVDARAVAPRDRPRVAVRARALAPLSTFAASADATEAADPAAVAAANDAAAEQGLVVRAIKEAKKNGEASKEQVDAEVAKLLELKKLAADLENPTQEATPDAKKRAQRERRPPRPRTWASRPRAKITRAGTWT